MTRFRISGRVDIGQGVHVCVWVNHIVVLFLLFQRNEHTVIAMFMFTKQEILQQNPTRHTIDNDR